MHLRARFLALATATLALSLAAHAQSTYVFKLDQAASNFTWSGTSTFGSIVGNPSNQFQLLGTQNVDLALQPGAQPFATIGMSGGNVTTNGPLHGKIPNPISILPPLATIDVNGLVLSASASSVSVGAGGAFVLSTTLTALDGDLVVTPITGSPSTTDLSGNTSNPTNVSGTITKVGNGWRLNGPVSTTFQFSDPGSGQSGSITLVGTIVGDFALFQSYCPGDGSGTACPCGNNSPVGQGRGCLSSTGIGARISGTGTASLTADTLVLGASSMPTTTTALFFQGTTQPLSGAGAVFGDGLRCVAGSVVRLGTKPVTGGVASYPVAGDPSVSVKGGVTSAGSTRGYQAWYRNAASFCTASTFNLTNGMSVTWSN